MFTKIIDFMFFQKSNSFLFSTIHFFNNLNLKNFDWTLVFSVLSFKAPCVGTRIHNITTEYNQLIEASYLHPSNAIEYTPRDEIIPYSTSESFMLARCLQYRCHVFVAFYKKIAKETGDGEIREGDHAILFLLLIFVTSNFTSCLF